MDAELERRWRNRLSPFDGLTVSPADLLPLSSLRQALAAVVNYLEPRHPQARLAKLMDWHEHDGFITEAERTTWPEIRSWLGSEEELIAHTGGDDYVRVGIFPDDRQFYFRFYVDETKRVGDFDVTGPRELVEDVAAAVDIELRREPAKAYFDARYAG